ncbi:MAG: helicase-related protein, partial [Planctomycetota bacterium]|nr:helicase-related protein [Planctomycetota bacterium]
QVGLRCKAIEGQIASYPKSATDGSDPEEEELSLQYRNNRTWAIGHGVATNSDGTPPEHVSTTYFPRCVVPGVTFELESVKKDCLSWTTLASTESRHEIAQLLDQFVDEYASWVATQKGVEYEDVTDQTVASRITSRQTSALGRMKKGVDLIRNSPEVHRAFRLANEAILMQRIRNLDEFSGAIKSSGQASHRVPNYFDPSELAETGATGWRPFQLAFILLVIPSLVDPHSDDRSLVDLLWFPTGGGKTEAYLGLAAFEIFRRRIMDGPKGCGTAVIKRYTYRVLTFQQFERASTLMACCEYLRQREGDLESAPITVGLWVGQNITPNTYSNPGHTKKYEDTSAIGVSHKLSGGVNPYQILKCPWCGTRLVEEDGSKHGFEVGDHHFTARCTDPNCFCSAQDGIPAQVIDEDLYQSPPSMLIGTIDKFTQLAWNEESGSLLGRGEFDSPSLFIQDELHLINGPLGTLAGLYECAVEQICKENSQYGTPAKIIGATATIRRSSQQCKALYAKDSAIFPPPGVTSDDSYFMRIDRNKPGRMYAGIMGQGHTPLTSFVHLSAAAGMAPLLDALNDTPDEKDGYWTQVVYLNSRRELSQTITAAVDDIPKRMRVLSERDGTEQREFNKSKIREISGTTRSEDIPELLTQLDNTLSGRESPVDFLGSTSILSVGVDKPRLGLMIMNGQPKTTSEYIQASSRIGRGSTPGIVLTHYSAAKPRDRSHYESFQAFHESIYRYVEPVSVTPWALPARERALPATIVASVRHSLKNMSNNSKAKSVIKNMPREVREIA